MKKKKKIIIGLVVVGVIVIFVLANLFKSQEKSYKVEVEKIKKGDITSIVSASGKIQPIKEVKISAYVAAKITHLPVEDGDRVRKGDLLVQLDPARYRAIVKQNQAQMKLAKARLEQAELVYQRQKELFEKKLTSQQQFDEARTEYNIALAEHDRNMAALEQAKDDFSKTTITSPMSGIVTELNAEVGEIVMIGTMNNPGTVIMTISDLSEIEVEIEVDETDIALVDEDQEAKIEIDAFPDTSFDGKVTEISNTARITGYGTQEQVTNFLVKVLLLDEVGGIKPGMSASVDITAEFREDVFKAPIASVVLRPEKQDSTEVEEGTKSEALASDTAEAEKEEKEEEEKKKEVEGIFVMEDNTAKFVKVETGISDQQNIEIVTGLEQDQKIIVGPYKTLRQLKDGYKVKVTKKEKEKKK